MKPGDPTRTVSALLSREQWALLQIRVKADGITVADLVRAAIAAYLRDDRGISPGRGWEVNE